MRLISASGVTRRRFLHGLGSALAASTWRPLPMGAAPVASAMPRLRFVQINDLHVQSSNRVSGVRPTAYLRVNEKARWLVDEINRSTRPDFVLGIGDLIHGSALEQLPEDMSVFQEIIRSLKTPFYPAVGNHEVVQREGDARYERAYREAFGDERVNYTFEAAGVRFIIFNNSGAPEISPAIVSTRNAWVRGVLQAHPHQPKILGCHIPVVPIREEAVLAKSFGFSSYAARDPELLNMVDDYAASIIAVLSGHLHLTGVAERKGVRHISIAGTASYPSDFARFEVFDDRLTVQVCQLPAELARATPSIHGRPRYQEDFTDAAHETAELYQAGRAGERNLTIRFKRAPTRPG